MGLALTLGPQLTLHYVPRSIWYLPLARRDIWRAGWLVATVGVTLLTTAVKLAAMLVPDVRDSFGLASLALSGLYDFAIAGFGCGLVILATRPQPTRGPWRPVSAFLGGLATLILLSGLLLGLYGSLVVRHVLPIQWTDLTAWSVAALVAALGLTVATYFHSPAPPGLASHPFFERAPVKGGPPRFELVRLSGLPRLLVHEAAWTLMIIGCLVAGSVLFVIVMAGLPQSPEGLAGFLRSVFLRLDGSVPQARASGIEAFVLLVVFAVFSGSLTGRFPTMIRHLRVLPLGTARLNALLIAWPAVDLADGVDAHAGAARPRPRPWSGRASRGRTPRADRRQRHRPGHDAVVLGLPELIVFVPLTLIVPLVLFLDAPSPAVFVIVGLGGLAAAVALNHAIALARRSTYTAAGPTLAGGSDVVDQNWK